VPAVATGVHSCLGGAHNAEGELTAPLTSSWEDFVQSGGAVLCPDHSQVTAWAEKILLDCYHKRDVYNGEWYHT
jgi:hypothetical protein